MATGTRKSGSPKLAEPGQRASRRRSRQTCWRNRWSRHYRSASGSRSSRFLGPARKDWGGPGHGLFDMAGKPKPALTAYQTVAAELAQTRYLGPWKGPVRGAWTRVRPGGQPVLVLWTPSAEGKIPVELKTASAKLSLRLVTCQTVEIPAAGGRAKVDAMHAPVFISGLGMTELSVTPVFISELLCRPAGLGHLAMCGFPSFLRRRPPGRTLCSAVTINWRCKSTTTGEARPGAIFRSNWPANADTLASGHIPWDCPPGTSRPLPCRDSRRPATILPDSLANST